MEYIGVKEEQSQPEGKKEEKYFGLSQQEHNEFIKDITHFQSKIPSHLDKWLEKGFKVEKNEDKKLDAHPYMFYKKGVGGVGISEKTADIIQSHIAGKDKKYTWLDKNYSADELIEKGFKPMKYLGSIYKDDHLTYLEKNDGKMLYRVKISEDEYSKLKSKQEPKAKNSLADAFCEALTEVILEQ